MTETDILTLYTIGHSNLSQDEFLTYLRNHNIRVLLDVRSAPYSRYVPHFNKNQLEPFLKQHDVDYRYAGEFLGGQPKDETVYKSQEVPEEGTDRTQFLKLVQYEDVMQRDWYQKGIRRLLEILAETQGGVVVMCSEGNPLECHRHHLIARSLIDPSVRIITTKLKVLHITKGGNIESVESTDFTEHNLPRQPRLL